MKTVWIIIGIVVVLAALGTGGFLYWKHKQAAMTAPRMSAADMQKLQAWQTEHAQGLQFQQFISNVARLEIQGKNTLTQDQAKQILAVLDPLRKQDKLTEDDAATAQQAVNNVLTDAQTAEMRQYPSSRPNTRTGGTGGAAGGQSGANGGAAGGGNFPQGGGAGGGNYPRGGGATGGRPGGQGGQRFDVNAMISRPFNPLKTSGGATGYPNPNGSRIDYLFQELDAKANGKPLPPKPAMGQGRGGAPRAGTPPTGGAAAPAPGAAPAPTTPTPSATPTTR